MTVTPPAEGTIVAPATPWGRAAVGWVRLSGEHTDRVVATVCVLRRDRLPPPRRARRVRLRDAEGEFDEGLLLWMPGPRSYTGEDTAEISCHGNPMLVDRLVRACQRAGARLAAPGEFTRRAWMNGRMDLPRAEAVLQTIEARTARGLEVARQGLEGVLSDWNHRIREDLVGLAAEMEAALDFPEEALVDTSDEAFASRIGGLGADLRRKAATFDAGHRWVHGAQVALVGPVNAGKSTLFNALLGRTRALVSPRPGTTRDVVESTTRMGGVQVRLLDTAGDREEADELEAAGIALRQELLDDVDLLVVVVPAHRPEWTESRRVLAATRERPRVVVGSHVDLPGSVDRMAGVDLLPVCGTTGEGVEALRMAVEQALSRAPTGGEGGETDVIIASQRQRDLLLEAARHLEAAEQALGQGAGLAVASTEVHEAIGNLGSLGGHAVRESVIDALFSRFCIGK